MSVLFDRAFDDWLDPGPLTPIFGPNRPLRTREGMSVYGDDSWNLNPAIFESHVPSTRMNFTLVAEEWRPFMKRYVYMLINRELDATKARLRHQEAGSSIQTIKQIQPSTGEFLAFLLERNITTLADVTHSDLDDYQLALRTSGKGVDHQRKRAREVRRLWDYRDLLPPGDRLPEAPPWRGRSLNDLLGKPADDGVNKTPRINPDTMQGLLAWSLRFVEDFSADIVPAVHAHQAILTHEGRRELARPRLEYGTVGRRLRDYLNQLQTAGEPLPGKVVNGRLRVDHNHIARVLEVDGGNLTISAAYAMIAQSGLPVVDYAPLGVPITASIGGQPWLPRPIGYDDVPSLTDRLLTACLVVVTYLSGMRPGEVLNLERGCVSHDPVTDIWAVSGRHFKPVRSVAGEKVPEGETRQIPWTVIEPVAHAIKVVEALHEGDLLFPRTIVSDRKRKAHITAQTSLVSSMANVLLNRFVDWVNDYCNRNGRTDHIPVDPSGLLNLSRFRRTLAYHICRRPRGLVAASIQYGHVLTQVTVGYAGTLASGFPDEYAFERMLSRLDDLGELNRQLEAGAHVSGPAADVLKHRAAQHEAFEGAALTTTRQAKALLANPDLQVIPGRGMHCVPNPAQALCRQRTDIPDDSRTPDLTDCRPSCQNIARRDIDIDILRERSQLLRDIVNDPLAPPLRVAREQAELDRLATIIESHDHVN